MQGIVFLLDAVFSFFIVLFLLRFLMQWSSTSFFNPLGELVLKLTAWASHPLRKFIRSYGKFDWASLICAILGVIILKIIIAVLMFGNLLEMATPESIFTLALSCAFYLLRLVLDIYVFVILGSALLSWVNPHSAIAYPLHTLSAPILNPIRKFMPKLSGIDLSPLVAILLIQTLLIYIPG